jgi:hypothetical protein
MAGKKKSMDGGKLFGLLSNKPIFHQEYNTHLKTIKNFSKTYKTIDPSKISVNNLNTKVKLLNRFGKTIEKYNSFQPLLEQLKLQLIEKIELSLREFISTKFIHDHTILFPELLDNLLHQLKEFEKLLNLLRLLDNQSNLSNYSVLKESFIDKILINYEKYIEQIFYNNPTIDILQQLLQQVQKYIRLYTEFIESMTNNRKINNPISKIIDKLNILSNQIFIKIELLLSKGTNNTGNHLSNEMKRRINLLYKNNINISDNFIRMQNELQKKYQNKPNYSLVELSKLAKIGSKINLINRISNKNNKNILLKDLRDTIIKSKNSLEKYPEFQEYEKLIIPPQ